MTSSFIALALTSSYWSRSILPSKFSTSTVVAMKFTRKGKLSMLRIAPMASFAAILELAIIWLALSLMVDAMPFRSALFSLVSTSSR